MNAFVEFGLADLVGDRKAFVNLGPDLTFEEFPFTEYQDRLVLEILESIPIDASLLNAIKRMKEQGFTVALDDVVYRPDIELLLPYVDIIKMDLSLIPDNEIADQLQLIRRQTSASILAEKIEQPEMFRRCLNLGFDYFQGYFSQSRLSFRQVVFLKAVSRYCNSSPNFRIPMSALPRSKDSLNKMLRSVISCCVTSILR